MTVNEIALEDTVKCIKELARQLEVDGGARSFTALCILKVTVDGAVRFCSNIPLLNYEGCKL